MPTPSGQHTQIDRQLIEGWFEFGPQRLAKDLVVLGLDRTLVPHSRAIQPEIEVIVRVAHMSVSGHLSSMVPLNSVLSMDSGAVKIALCCAIALPAARLC